MPASVLPTDLRKAFNSAPKVLGTMGDGYLFKVFIADVESLRSAHAEGGGTSCQLLQRAHAKTKFHTPSIGCAADQRSR